VPALASTLSNSAPSANSVVNAFFRRDFASKLMSSVPAAHAQREKPALDLFAFAVNFPLSTIDF
jgi:hypothetical protein